MGSANKTANYGLNQWQSNEYPKRDDFNADNAAIDSALKANADGVAQIPAPSSAAPAMDGTAAAGGSGAYARADHVHPTDTSRAAKADLDALSEGMPVPSSAAPAMDGTAAAGSSVQYARSDHVHPTDNTRAAASVAVSATLTAAGWTGSAAPYTQTVAVAGLGANQNGHTQIADGTTPAQRAAARYANMTKTAQAAGSITITADGTKPSIDIPITVVLEG